MLFNYRILDILQIGISGRIPDVLISGYPCIPTINSGWMNLGRYTDLHYLTAYRSHQVRIDYPKCLHTSWVFAIKDVTNWHMCTLTTQQKFKYTRKSKVSPKNTSCWIKFPVDARPGFQGNVAPISRFSRFWFLAHFQGNSHSQFSQELTLIIN